MYLGDISCKIILFLFLMNGILTEPHCSKFHYEEKLLEKMIKLEIVFQNMKTEVENLSDSTKKTLSDLQEEREKWIQSVADMKETNIQQLSSSVLEAKDKIKDELDKLRDEKDALYKLLKDTNAAFVGFSARFATSESFESGQTMTYKEVLLNEGDAYNIEDGVFTVPVSGIYIFTAQFCVHGDKLIDFAFVANERAFKLARIYSKLYLSCHSFDAVSAVDNGDYIKIKIIAASSGTLLHDRIPYYWNMFSGVLVQPK